MKDLPPEASALLARARTEHEPTSGELARTLDKLHQSLDFTRELADPQPIEPSSLGRPLVRAGLLSTRIKAVLLTVVLGGLVAVGVRSLRPRQASVSRTSIASSPFSASAPATRRLSNAAKTTKEVAVNEEPEHAEPLPAASAKTTANQQVTESPRAASLSPHAPRKPARAQTRASSAVDIQDVAEPPAAPDQPAAGQLGARSPLDSSLWDELEPPIPSELELIDGALSSLRQHDPKRSLSLLAQHAELYPHGMLATERRGLRVLALCAGGNRAQAARERATFLSTSAHTPMAERVRRSCRPDGEP